MNITWDQEKIVSFNLSPGELEIVEKVFNKQSLDDLKRYDMMGSEIEAFYDLMYSFD
jgi:hypothetical protein